MVIPKYYVGFERINKIGKIYVIKNSDIRFDNFVDCSMFFGKNKPFILLKIISKDFIKIFCEGKIMFFDSCHFYSTECTLEIEELE